MELSRGDCGPTDSEGRVTIVWCGVCSQLFDMVDLPHFPSASVGLKQPAPGVSTNPAKTSLSDSGCPFVDCCRCRSIDEWCC